MCNRSRFRVVFNPVGLDGLHFRMQGGGIPQSWSLLTHHFFHSLHQKQPRFINIHSAICTDDPRIYNSFSSGSLVYTYSQM